MLHGPRHGFYGVALRGSGSSGPILKASASRGASKGTLIDLCGIASELQLIDIALINQANQALKLLLQGRESVEDISPLDYLQ